MSPSSADSPMPIPTSAVRATPAAIPAAAILAATILAAALAVPPPAAAQTTDTERQAAGAILAGIDSLEAELQVTRRAERLARRDDADRDRLLERVAELWDTRMEALSDWIGRHPEVGFEEERAVDTLTSVLRRAGFDVTTGVADLPTAFVARWTSPAGGDGPTLGLIGEYDALRGTEGPFHGDQHNAQTPVALAAAFALQEYMTGEELPGSIVVYGTPAEEVPPPAKATLYRAGVFEGADILVRSHSSTGTARSRAGFGVCCLDINAVKYVFTGQPSHQRLSWFGRNALSAAVQFYTAVDHLRPTFRPEASIQGVIPEGGVAPNVVPDRAVVDYFLRYPDEVYLEHITGMIDDAARGAALASGTEVEIDRYGEYRDGIALGTLEELFYAYAEKLGAPRLQPERERPAGYEETGFVSRDVPGVGVTVYSSTAANHTFEMERDAFTEVGHTGFRMDARIMAAVLYHFLVDADFREAVRREHRTLAGLLTSYVANLRDAYADEFGRGEGGGSGPGGD